MKTLSIFSLKLFLGVVPLTSSRMFGLADKEKIEKKDEKLLGCQAAEKEKRANLLDMGNVSINFGKW